jgi:hypothetical protein
MAAHTLHLVNQGQGSFGAKLAGAQSPQPWNGDMVLAYLIAHGYSEEDADAIVNQAEIAREIEIFIPSD